MFYRGDIVTDLESINRYVVIRSNKMTTDVYELLVNKNDYFKDDIDDSREIECDTSVLRLIERPVTVKIRNLFRKIMI